MKENRWKIVHLALISLALVFCIVCVALLFGGAWLGVNAEDGKGEGASRAIFYLISLLSLVGCGIYALKEYEKGASLFYNVFFCLQLVASFFCAVLEIVFFAGGAIPVLSIIVLFGKAAAIALLIFLSDLGKKKAWIFFGIIGVLELIGSILVLADARLGIGYRICAFFARIIVCAAIALAIRGKYADKAIRQAEQE